VAIVEGATTGRGVEMIPMPCSFVQFPEVFSTTPKVDRLVNDYSTFGAIQSLGALVAKRSFEEVRLTRHYQVELTQARCARDLTEPSGATIPANEKVERPTNPESFAIELRLAGTHPLHSESLQGHMPVNECGQRLDCAITAPSESDQLAYTKEFQSSVKPCRRHHLAATCHLGDACLYDHSELNANVLEVLQYHTKRTPCQRGSECRRIDCIYGHVCQDIKCSDEILEDCPLRRFHGVDLTVAAWVEAEEVENYVDCTSSERPQKEGDNTPVQSSFTARLRGDLPKPSHAPPGHIPVNEHGQRLDCVSKARRKLVRDEYAEKYNRDNRPCRWFHLKGLCPKGDLCDHDHSEMSTELKQQFRHSVMRNPCSRGSQCRRLDCLLGHVCQDYRCLKRKHEMCRLKEFHSVSPVLHSWVQGEPVEERANEAAAESSTEEVSETPVESFWF